MVGADPHLNLDIGASQLSLVPPARDQLPPIAALFVIYFDIKAGYTIAWKQTAQGVSLDGVEFKCLPSGLHNLKEDLVYFVHGTYAGVSAFINQPAGEAERNALMLSVGVLVPLSYGRLGRSWRHAQNLKELASTFSLDTTNHDVLSEYYIAHRLPTPVNSPPSSPVDSPSSLRYRPSASKGYKPASGMDGSRPHARNRSISDTTMLISSTQITSLSPYHPALSLLEFLDTFGPLVFPLYRAALCRKRILIITQAPVQTACNFVYNISILSTIPLSVSSLISPTSAPDPSRLRPLFSIGVHDIPFLEEQAKHVQQPHSTPLSSSYGYNNAPTGTHNSSWVACTTDGVLYLKSSLYDVVVTLPPPHSKHASSKVYPKIEAPAGVPLKATQRDLRRYRALRSSLERYNLPPPDVTNTRPSFQSTPQEEESVCEKCSWAELAYSGFLWWASAGERRNQDSSTEHEDGFEPATGPSPSQYRPPPQQQQQQQQHHDENIPLLSADTDADSEIFDDHNSSADDQNQANSHHRHRRSSILANLTSTLGSAYPQTPGLSGPDPNSSTSPGTLETDIIAYFHRLTTRIVSGLSEIISDSVSSPPFQESNMDGSGDEGSGETAEKGVWISKEEMVRLGLDRWSEGDEVFLEEVVRKYFGRDVEVEGGKIGWCC